MDESELDTFSTKVYALLGGLSILHVDGIAMAKEIIEAHDQAVRAGQIEALEALPSSPQLYRHYVTKRIKELKENHEPR